MPPGTPFDSQTVAIFAVLFVQTSLESKLTPIVNGLLFEQIVVAVVDALVESAMLKTLPQKLWFQEANFPGDVIAAIVAVLPYGITR